ncbi:MAG: dihydrolipoamide acetyltransferase family protein [Anaerolineae bacterium]|nr:dihydrolipoamide acetyltransferase family protein [Anaerolineae bacterium]
MGLEITMPQLGLTMERGKVVKWLVGVGDTVERGQPIFEVETDKAIVTVEAQQSGKVARILVAEGEEAPVGAAVAVLEGAAAPEAAPPPEAKPEPKPAPEAVRLPVSAVRVEASWKARAEARKAGLDIGSIAGTGPGGRVVAADVARALAAKAAAVPAVKATPAAEKLAAALGLEVSGIAGTGPGGRVMEEDVVRAAAEAIRGRGAVAAAAAGVVDRVPLTGVRGLVSRRMAESARETARVTLFREVDAGALVRLRERLKGEGVEATYNDILVRLCAEALRRHPDANARLGDGVIEHLGDVNIGLAVDTERGLLVVVIKGADRLNLREIARERGRLVEGARSGRIGPDDLRGGTFTITNLGMYGVEGFTPVINLPECCILGVGRIVKKPVAVDDAVVVRPMMVLSLTFDHRVIDGAPAARFLDTIARLVEEPALILT